MGLKFECSCGRGLEATRERAGKTMRCPACSEVVPVPEIPVAVAVTLTDAREMPGYRRAEQLTAPLGPPRTCGYAVVTFALALVTLLGPLTTRLGLVPWFFGGLAAALIAGNAWSRVRASKGALSGRRWALSGILIGLGQALIVTVLFVTVAVRSTRDFVEDGREILAMPLPNRH